MVQKHKSLVRACPLQRCLRTEELQNGLSWFEFTSMHKLVTSQYSTNTQAARMDSKNASEVHVVICCRKTRC